MKIRDLRMEYRNNPIGIDSAPRFSWKIESDCQNVVQTGWQIQVSSENQMIWDSGKTESDVSVLVPYGGRPLKPQKHYDVLVTVWNNLNEMTQETGFFETGLMGAENWKGKWITHTLPEDETCCGVFVTSFACRKTLSKARLYATACGVYEAKINGRKAGDAFLAPGWTSYHNRVQYQTYDVTDLIQDDNTIRITVGNGWYKSELGFDARPNIYGDRTAVNAFVWLMYEDGSEEVIATDTDWDVETGPIRFAEIYHGETQDYTAQPQSFGKAVRFETKGRVGIITGQESEPVRITKRFVPKEVIHTPKGETVFDFGQNLTGFVEVKLPVLKGESLVIKHAETLDKDGNFYTENLRTARCTDTYIYSSAMEGKTVMPHFTFHGFRYIAVEGAGTDVSADHFTACAMHTDMEKTISFTTNNKLVNQLVSNIEWGQRDNFLDVPTDCPQRDERLGWTGDAQVFASTASMNFNTALFFRKWLYDMKIETSPEWGVPHVVPNILGDQAGAAAWSDAGTIIPWRIFNAYGDRNVLAEEYPLMKAWVDYMHAHASENGLWDKGFQYGDWLALDIESGSTDRTGGTDKYLVANAYYAYSTRIVSQAASVLGYSDDARTYADLFETVREAVNREFVTATGRLVSETQTACVVMLYFDLAKLEYRSRILSTLEANINSHHSHLTTGFVGTPYLCHCLSENGLHDLAAEIFLKEDCPGWLYAVKKGATTIWERWNSIDENGDFDQSGMNSLNHYAYGSIGSWLYEKGAGIRAEEPGYKKIRIEPLLTRGLSEISASYESVYGTIGSHITCKDGKITVEVRIPANTSALIVLPERNETIEVGSGSYTWNYETSTNLEVQKYSFESTLGDLVATEIGRNMFEQFEPGMLDNPLIKFAYAMTISDLLAQGPEAKPMYQAVIDALNAQEKEENS